MTPAHQRRRPLAAIPIGIKLPLVAGLFVLTVSLIFAVAAYVAVRQTLLTTASERQQQIGRLFVQLYGGAAGIYQAQAVSMAGGDPIRAYVTAPAAADQYAALNGLEYKGSPGQDSLVLAVELLSSSGEQLLVTGRGREIVTRRADRSSLPRPVRPDSGMVGRFQTIGDSIVYPVVARIRGAEPTGYVVVWRRVVGSAETRSRIGELIGTRGTLLSGNADGSVWTDLTRGVDGPALTPASFDSTITYRRPGIDGELLGYPLEIPGTPWVLMVEFSLAAALAPISGFVRSIAAIGLVGVSVALLLAGLLSVRLTRPLQRLTVAAKAITSGEQPERLDMGRTDELGTLGAAFDTMAVQVSDSRQRLEEEVAARTGDLNDTLTQLRDAQESLVRREKLATLGQLAGSVGHELRNPLGVISNAVYYLNLVLADATPEVREYMGIVRNQVHVSSKIINDLLDFSRVARPERHPVCFRTLVDSQLANVAVPANVAVEVHLPENLPKASADPVQIGQVMLNLLTNAVQAMEPDGGRLCVTGSSNGDGMVRVTVRDTGPGIEPASRAKVFEPLFTTKARGIGLGLAVSRSLVAANEGTLTCDGSTASGAEFVLALPSIDGAAS